MQAVRIHQFGGVDVLRIEDVARPEPGDGEVLIQVRAASLNPVDYKTREGKYPPIKAETLPVMLGRDVAGVVAEAGSGVSDIRAGEEVYAMLPNDRGGFAEWVAVPANICAAKPTSLDLIQAAAVPLAALTAWQGLFTHGALQGGQRVLIHGAAGGVGSFAVQLAAVKGADVYATASADNRGYVESLGAARVIDYRQERFEDLVQDLDLVFDLIGGETETRSWQVLKRGGRLISTVQEPDAGRAAEAGVTARRYMAEPNGAQLIEIARLIDNGHVRVRIDKIFALDDAVQAERRLQQDHITGKIVLEIARP